MDTPVRYQVVFSGHLRKGHAEADVKKRLARQLKRSAEELEPWFAGGRGVLTQTPSREEARRIVMQLAAIGAIATIEPGSAEPAVAGAGAPAGKGATLGKFQPLRNKKLLRPALYLSAAVEVLFSLLYAGLVLALIAGVLYPSLTSPWVGQFVASPLLALPLQLLVIVLTGLFLLMLLKPLLALRINYHQGVPIPAAQEPDLHAFIEDLCERIGAPMPTEIRLYNDADIKTAYHRGPLGFLRNRTVLTLGVPLVAGMNCSQMAALIARSLNRYRHKFAPRATAILLAGHAWLQRAVYEQDIIDRALLRWHQEGRLGDGMFRALHWLVVPARRMVALRLRLSRALDRRVIHRIVAEADKMALLFTGTDGFIRLLDQNSLLAFAGHNLLPGLEAQWQKKGALPDNLVQMMVLRSRQYPVSMPQKLRALQEQQKAAIGDILPSDTQRLKRVGHKPIYGAYYCLSPAAVLFRNYSKLTHLMTLRFYHHRLQLPVSPYRLQQVSGRASLEKFLQQRLDAHFRRLYADFLPLKLRQRMRGIGNLAEAKKQWGIGMARSRSEYERAVLARERFRETEAALVDSATLEEIYLAGLWRQWGEEKLKNSELNEVHQAARDGETEHEQAAHTLEQYLKAHGMRMGAVLAALTHAEDKLLDGASTLRQEVHLLVSMLERIENVDAQLRELKLQTILLETLLSYRSVRRRQKLENRIEQHSSDVKHLVAAVGLALKSAPYPFADRKAKQLMVYVLQDALTDDTPQGHFDRGNDTVERLALVQRRALVRLVEITEQVEGAMGLRG